MSENMHLLTIYRNHTSRSLSDTIACARPPGLALALRVHPRRPPSPLPHPTAVPCPHDDVSNHTSPGDA